MDPLTMMGVQMGVGLLGALLSGQDQNSAQAANGGDSSDDEPPMPQDTVQLSDPNHEQHDDAISKNLPQILAMVCKFAASVPVG